jgi:hypothetical protein
MTPAARKAAVLPTMPDAGGSESNDAELSYCTLIVLNYLEQADQRKIGKKS